MDAEVYRTIESYCHGRLTSLEYVNLADLETELKIKNVSFQTLVAIMSQTVQKYLKKTSYKGKDYKLIEQVGYEFFEMNKTLREIALSISYPPFLVGKMVLNYALSKEYLHIHQTAQKDHHNVKDVIKRYAYDPSLIGHKRLREQIEYWHEHDPYTSPNIDRLKHATGEEYEFILTKKLGARNITFQAEEALKLEGAEKTPDALITIPFAVRSRTSSGNSGNAVVFKHHVVNWIDSKAMFGDEKEHMKYMKQYISYRSRYGPGMVIYWFGYVETIADFDNDILVMSDFPLKSDIVFM